MHNSYKISFEFFIRDRMVDDQAEDLEREIAKILASRSRKIPKILRKNDFRGKIFFLIVIKVMLILRFPHSFGVWGCWGRSKSTHFAIFRGFRCPELAPADLLSEACPSESFSENKNSRFL